MRIKLAAAVAAIAFASPAYATTVVDGKCASVTSSSGCLFSGNINSNPMSPNGFVAAQNAYNLYNNSHPSANPDITLNVIAASDDSGFSNIGSITGGAGSNGSWTLNGYLVNFVAVKSADFFVLYQLSTPSSTGSWDTFDIPYKKNPHDLSHLVFFGQAVSPSVPEPASWAMMIAGFGFVGGAMRTTKRRADAAAVA